MHFPNQFKLSKYEGSIHKNQIICFNIPYISRCELCAIFMHIWVTMSMLDAYSFNLNRKHAIKQVIFKSVGITQRICLQLSRQRLFSANNQRLACIGYDLVGIDVVLWIRFELHLYSLLALRRVESNMLHMDLCNYQRCIYKVFELSNLDKSNR